MADANPTPIVDAAETWLPIAGYEGRYEVSDMGRIKALDCRLPVQGGSTRSRPGRIIKPKVGINGYLNVILHLDRSASTRLCMRLC